MFNSPRTTREHAANLVIVLAILVIGFGCFCGNNRRGASDAGSGDGGGTETGTASNKTAGKKPSKKANTKSDTAKKSEAADNGDFTVEYVDVEDQRYESISNDLREQKVLENAARNLNKNLALPYDIKLTTRDCGEINAFYNPKDHSVTMCYEIMDFYYNLFLKAEDATEEKANQKMSDTMQFIFLHELGHALIDAYQLPVTGNEEDAADKLSSYINLNELGDSGSRAAIAAAQAFNLQSQMQGDKELPFYDEHSLDQQRFYNILCQLYGSDESKYEVLVTKGALPEQRAVRCPKEFQDNVRTWNALLKQYRKQ